ncbi:MAG TPA: YceI family protein [Saprospiraceae bacterium]|nr:YceI family protein [Saprospiraceae bacterium]
MLNALSIFKILLLVVGGMALCGASGRFTSANGTLFKKRYTIESGSKMYLYGTTNVNNFTCHCEDQFGTRFVELESSGWKASYKDATLDLSVGGLNCRNRKIENDLRKALKAEQYPNIRIKLLETIQNPDCIDGKCQGWFDIYAKMNLTITGVTRTRDIHARAKLLAPKKLQLVGEQTLYMTDFGITPPEAMLGMIRVNDQIDFHFDLIVTTD